MPLAELERWLQDRADRHPVATSIPMLDGYVAAIVAGPVSIEPARLDLSAARHRCRCLQSRRHPGVRGDLALSRGATTTSAASSRPPRIGSSRCIGASPMATSIRVPGAEDSTPPCGSRMSDWAPLLDTSDVNHGLLLPILLHCRDDQGRPLLGPTTARAARPGNFCATPTRYSSGRRGHAPILDADPLRPRGLIAAYVGTHTGYDQTLAVTKGFMPGPLRLEVVGLSEQNFPRRLSGASAGAAAEQLAARA